MGNLVSSDRLKPDTKKIEAIINMLNATDVNRYSVSWNLSSILLSRGIAVNKGPLRKDAPKYVKTSWQVTI